MIHEYGISNKQYAAVAAGSLALAACLVCGIRAGYAAVDAAEAQGGLSAEERAALEIDIEAAEAMAVTPTYVTDTSAAQAAVAELIANAEGEVCVSVRMVDGSGGFDFNGSEAVQSASMIKLLVLAEYLDQVDSGEVSPTETYELADEDVVSGSGTMQDDRPGTVYTLDEVARRMIYQSDNTATNVLIDRLGMEDIAEKRDELGLDGTQLTHKLMLSASDNSHNQISANDAALILGRIANNALASEKACDRAEEFLLEQEDDEGLAEGLPEGVAFGHKTGTVDYVRHDGGIVYAKHPYVICVLTDGLGYDTANDLMAQISAAVYDALK